MTSADGAEWQFQTWRSVTTTDSPTVLDELLQCSASGGAFTVTLPAASSATSGKVWCIRKTDSSVNAVTVSGTAFSRLLYFSGDTILVLDTGSNHSLVLETRTAVQPTVQRFTSGSGTYNTPAGCIRLRVRMVGGGGGGGGNNVTVGNASGTAGGDTTFGTRTAGGGSGGRAGNAPSSGGAPSGSGYTLLAEFTGTRGQSAGRQPTTTGGSQIAGGAGGSSPFGGGGAGGSVGANGVDAVTNTGSGGGGGGSDNVNSQYAGSGGNAGAYLEFFITSPAASYSYGVGAGGAGGTGTGRDGGAGAAGYIVVEEFYQ